MVSLCQGEYTNICHKSWIWTNLPTFNETNKACVSWIHYYYTCRLVGWVWCCRVGWSTCRGQRSLSPRLLHKDRHLWVTDKQIHTICGLLVSDIGAGTRNLWATDEQIHAICERKMNRYTQFVRDRWTDTCILWASDDSIYEYVQCAFVGLKGLDSITLYMRDKCGHRAV